MKTMRRVVLFASVGIMALLFVSSSVASAGVRSDGDELVFTSVESRVGDQFRAVDPMALILSHQVYVKLNLPRPLPYEVLEMSVIDGADGLVDRTVDVGRGFSSQMQYLLFTLELQVAAVEVECGNYAGSVVGSVNNSAVLEALEFTGKMLDLQAKTIREAYKGYEITRNQAAILDKVLDAQAKRFEALMRNY